MWHTNFEWFLARRHSNLSAFVWSKLLFRMADESILSIIYIWKCGAATLRVIAYACYGSDAKVEQVNNDITGCHILSTEHSKLNDVIKYFPVLITLDWRFIFGHTHRRLTFWHMYFLFHLFYLRALNAFIGISTYHHVNLHKDILKSRSKIIYFEFHSIITN